VVIYGLIGAMSAMYTDHVDPEAAFKAIDRAITCSPFKPVLHDWPDDDVAAIAGWPSGVRIPCH
jgi:hypothetical protein